MLYLDRHTRSGWSESTTLTQSILPDLCRYQNYSSETPTISESNGKLLIAYESNAQDLGPSNTTGNYQIYLTTFGLLSNTGDIDYGTLSTKLISADSTGNGGNSTSQSPVFSKDGSTLGFESVASNLKGGSTNGYQQIYAYNIGTGTLSLVSHDSGGTNGGDNSSDSLSLSNDGQYIAFRGAANDLLSGVSGYQVYVWTQSSGSLTLISANSSGGADYRGASNPILSGDGNTVAFVSFGDDLTSSNVNPNQYYQVWSRDWRAGTPVNTLISVNSTGTVGGNNYSGTDTNLSISDNGQVIAFQSRATDLTSNSADVNDNNRQVFVRNVPENTTVLASVDSAGTNGGNNYAYTPAISANGGIVTFNSYATDLVAGVTVPNGDQNVYYTPVGAAQFVVTAASPQTAGNSFQITVTAETITGQVFTGYSGTVHFTSTDGKAVLPADSMLTNGTGTFTVTLKTAGIETITATDTADASLTGISNAITVNPNTPYQLVFEQQPTQTPAGQAIAPAVTVLEEDKYGNVETGDSTTQVNVALGGTSPSTALNGTLQETVKNGVATFADLSINQAGTGYQLVATSGTLISATSNAFTITAAPTPTKLVFLQQPTQTTAGFSISPAVTVLIEDQYNNVETGDNTDKVTLALSYNQTNGVLGGTLTETVSGGVATFANLSIDQAGEYTLVATSPINTNLTQDTSQFFAIVPATPYQMKFLTQPTDTAAGSHITPAVQVELLDQYGNVETGDYSDTVKLVIGPNSPAGTLNGTTTETVSAGVATFSDLSIDQAGNGYTLVASSPTPWHINPVTSTAFNITPGTPHLLYVTQPTDTMAGSTINTIQVAIEDQFGNVENTDNTDKIKLVLGSNSPAGPLNGTTTQTVSAGVATFNDLYIDLAGSNYTLVASSPTDAALSSITSNTFAITPAAASKLAFQVQPTTTVAGNTISPAVTVAIEDKYSNIETGDNTDKVSLALGGSSPVGGVLNGTTSNVQVSGGIATFGGLSINQAGAGYQLVATSGTLSQDTSNAFNIIPAGAFKLVFSQQPTDTTAGNSISPAVTVTIEDQYNNVLTGDSTDKVTVVLGGTSPPATLHGSQVQTVSGGIATFSDLTIDQAGSNYQLVASSTVNSTNLSVTSNAFNITPATPYKLAFLQQPTDATAGNTISPAVTVTIEDQYNNVETGDNTDKVSVALGGTSPTGGVLNGTTSNVQVTNGIATFADLSIDQAGTGYQLVASSTINSTNLSITSNAFNISPAGAYKLAFKQQPTDTVAGNTITPAVTVAVEDKYSNIVTGDNTDKVSLALGGSSPAGGVLNGSTSNVQVTNGIATFADQSIDQAGSGYQLVATSGTLTQDTSNAFNIIPAGAFKLVYKQQPTDTTAGNSISPAVTVAIEDKYNNILTGDSTDKVSLALGGSSPTGGVLNGTTSNVQVTNGVATFGDLSIDQAGTGYQLVASSTINSTNLSVTSNAFNITPAGAYKLVFKQQPTDAMAGASISPAVTVAIEDKYNNVETGDTTDQISVAIDNNPSNGTLNGTTSNVQVTNGIATFSNLSINQAGNGYTLQATGTINSTNLSVVSDAFNITPGAPHLMYLTQPTDTMAGATINTIKVAIEDQYGNVENTDNTDKVNLVLGPNSPAGPLNGTTPQTVSNGVATFSDLYIDLAGSNYTLVASSSTTPSLGAVTSNAFTITPAGAYKVVFQSQPTDTVAGNTISPAVTVAVEDKYNNIETGDSTDKVSLALGGTSPVGGVLNGTTSNVQVTNGIATFADLSIDQAGTGYQLVATSGTLNQDTSTAFAITPAGAYKLVYKQQPTDTTAGNSISPAVTVAIEDKYNNVLTGDSTDTVQLGIGFNPSNGILNGGASKQVSAGIATFDALSIDQAGVGYTLVASNTTLIQATSNDFNITPAGAYKLVFVQQPTNTAAGATVSPAVTVAIEDKYNNVETGDTTDQVSLAIGTNPAGGTLSGTTPQTVKNGVATFNDLSINNAGTGYTLVASSTVGTTALQVTSNPFDITSTGPVDISSDLNVVVGGHHLVYIGGKRYVEESLTITNITSDLTFTTGMTMVLTNLSTNATLYNQTGTYQGNPFVDLATPTGGLGPQQSMTVYLIFSDPTLKPITFGTTEYEGMM